MNKYVSDAERANWLEFGPKSETDRRGQVPRLCATIAALLEGIEDHTQNATACKSRLAALAAQVREGK